MPDAGIPVLKFSGQATFICSKRSRRIVAERLSARNPRLNWVRLDPVEFASADGPQAVAVLDWEGVCKENQMGGEHSAIRHSVSRQISRMVGDVDLSAVLVFVDEGPEQVMSPEFMVEEPEPAYCTNCGTEVESEDVNEGLGLCDRCFVEATPFDQILAALRR